MIEWFLQIKLFSFRLLHLGHNRIEVKVSGSITRSFNIIVRNIDVGHTCAT